MDSEVGINERLRLFISPRSRNEMADLVMSETVQERQSHSAGTSCEWDYYGDLVKCA